MKFRIKRVAILGSGTMGSGIAAQLANAGIPSYLLDIVPPNLSDEEKKNPAARNRIAEGNRQALLKSRPPQLMYKEGIDLITAGNMEDNLPWLSECDWVVEVVPENLEIKKSVLKSIAPYIKPGTIVSSNTSSISINSIAEDMPIEFRRYWLGTHFFNPVRYMKLLEIIPGRDTLPEVVQFMADFGERVLGKGVVHCKDTPAFIANRFGNWAGPKVAKLMLELGLTFSEVDDIVGPPMGRPGTGAFGLMDLVGLDIAVASTGTVKDNVTDPAEKEAYTLPQFYFDMLSRGILGNKTKGGFYKRVGKEKLMLDINTWDYVPIKPADFLSLEKARVAKTLPEKLEAFFEGDDKAAKLVWEFNKGYLMYAASKIPEVSDDILNVDRAMRWGYNHAAGPFEQWNGLDLKKYVARMEAEGETPPAWLKEMLELGFNSFYKTENGIEYYYSIPDKNYVPVKLKPEVIVLPALKSQNKVVMSTDAATLYDLGNGVLAFSITTRNAAVTPELLDAMIQAQMELKKPDWEGMVICGTGRNFCSGMDLSVIQKAIENKDWNAIDGFLKKMQDTFMGFKYSSKPVVAAPYGRTLGSGCELVMQSSATQAAAETNIGLIEFGMGLIPAGGGVKEMTMRAIERVKNTQAQVVDFLLAHFQPIASAQVSGSAKEGMELQYLKPTDGITFNLDFLLSDAKKRVLHMVDTGYNAPVSRPFPCPGKTHTALIKVGTLGMKLSGVISEYDWHICNKLVDVMSGGEVVKGAPITEQYLLDLEREAFISLCGEEKTQERIAHMLKTGKPLRN